MAGPHEVALVGRQVKPDERLAALGHGSGLVDAVGRQPRLQVLDPGIEPGLVVAGQQLGDRDVPTGEHGTAGGGPGRHLDLERLVGEPTPPQRREPPDLAGVVRPCLGGGQRGDDGVDGRHPNRGIRVPHLLVAGRLLRRQRAQAGQPHADLGVVGGAVLLGLKRDPPPAPPAIRVRLAEPVAEQPPGPLEQLLAGERSPGRAVGGESVGSEGAMERPQVGQMQPAPPRLAIPVGGQHRERQPEVVDVALRRRPSVVGGVQEVRDPEGGIAGGDRRSRHPGEAQQPGPGRLGRRLGIGRFLQVLGNVLGQPVGLILVHRATSGVVGAGSAVAPPQAISYPASRADKPQRQGDWEVELPDPDRSRGRPVRENVLRRGIARSRLGPSGNTEIKVRPTIL